MEFVIKSAKISASSDEHNWGGSFSENGLFIVLEVSGKEESPANTIGKEILNLLLLKFSNLKERNYSVATKLIEEVKENIHIRTIIIGFLAGGKLFLSGIGNGAVYMKRQHRLGQILAREETAQGEVQSGDRLLFSSKPLTIFVDKKSIGGLLSTDDPEEAVEVITPSLLDREDSKGTAVLVVAIARKKQNDNFLDSIVNFKNENKNRVVRFLNRSKEILKKRRRETAKTDEKKTKKTLLTISVILVALLVLSIFFNISHNRTSSKAKQLSEVLDLVTHQYEEAVGLVDLNPVRARELLSSSKLSLAPFISEFSKKSDEYRQIDEWLKKISTAEVDAYKIYKLTSVPLFFDINLVKQSGQANLISAYRETKAILDTVNKVVYYLSTDTKKSEILAGSDVVKDAHAITTHSKNVYILNSDGIIRLDISEKANKQIIKRDGEWGDIKAIAAFGGNIYLLDSRNNTIWKYIATDTGFSQRTSYLNPDVRADFSRSSSMVIDGSIWVLAGKSEVLKFTRGLGEPFAFSGLADSLENIGDIYTSDTEDNFYLLDKNGQRIMVFDKDGTYYSQYQWDELENASDFVVSEEEGKIFVSIGSKIYAIDIK